MSRIEFKDLTRREYVYVLVCLVILSAIAACILLTQHERDAEWIKFRAEHHCRAVAHHDSPEGPSIGIGSTTWACDDGSTYVKSDD